MTYQVPSHEELVNLSWLLDSALVCGHRAQAAEFATRLGESLLRYRAGLTKSRPAGGATTGARQDACVILLADLASVLTRLHHGDPMPRIEFRHRVEALAGEMTSCPGNAA